jgi:hypothetical protein
MIAVERSRTIPYTCESRRVARHFVGGTNESYAGLVETFKFIEADMDMDSFNRFAKLKRRHFIPIGEEGIYIPCYKFKSIHPSQQNDFDNHTENEDMNEYFRDLWYQHYVATGFYFLEDASDITFQGDKTLLVYDAENCRMFQFTGSPMWIRILSTNGVFSNIILLSIRVL